MECLGLGCESWGPQVWAAWVQALFSFLAIVVAIAVWVFQRNRQRKADQVVTLLEARSVALLACAACYQMTADLGEVLELQVAGTRRIFFGDAGRRAAKVPDELHALIPQLPLLGESGALLQELIQVLHGIQAMQRRYDRHVAGHLDDVDAVFPFIGEQFAQAMRLAQEAELRLDNLFEPPLLGANDLRQAIMATECDKSHSNSTSPIH